MRLRLTLLRPSLPPIKTLWPLPAGPQTLTISALLTLLSATFPLDSPTLGLETYSLSISGYEALHWQEVGSVLKDEDEVVVRAISGNEVRARRLGGREGVTEHGRRVLDGVAWGRGKGRAEGVVMKRGRDEEDVEDDNDEEEEEEWEGERKLRESKRVRFTVVDGEVPGEGEEEWMQQRLIEGPPLGGHRTLIPFGGEEDSEDDEDDEDFQGFEVEESEDSDAESDEAIYGEEDSSSEASTDSESSSDEEEDDSSDSPSTESSSESSDESVGNTSTDKSNRITAEPTLTPTASKPTRAGASKTRQLTNGIFSLTPNEMATMTPPVGVTLTNGKATNIPYEGLPATKARNVRRRDAKKLKYLKAAESLPADATLADLKEQKKDIPGKTGLHPIDQEMDVDSQRAEAANGSDDLSEGAIATGVGTAKSASAADSDTLARKRRRLLDAIESGGIEITLKKGGAAQADEDEEPDEMSSKQIDVPKSNGDPTTAELHAAENTPSDNDGTTEPPARGARLDLAGSQRHIFASLGVRAPKSDEQKEALRKKLATRRGPAAKAAIAAISASEAVAAEPDAPATAPEPEHPIVDSEPAYHWSDRIDLRAVECVDENVTLSTPPYPFHQRWDPQYHKRKNRNKASYMSGGKGKRQAQNHVETYDKYFPDQDGDYLDYGDEDGGEYEDGEYWDDNALLGDEDPSALQLQAEANATVALKPDLPALPEDISTLPLLPEADAAVGDIVTYTELVCEAATSWQPKMLSRTAELIEHDVERNEWGFRMAIRDMPHKTFDEEGNRVYAKFEMEGEDGEEEEEDVDERARVLSWSEMGEVRLLRKGQS
ncbi:hypothetical protein LTR95_010438 [Oleoguttula sp. CCFEE 5521]